jgi:predicted dehydrogenase
VTTSTDPVRVGVAGTGPWARTVHAPTFGGTAPNAAEPDAAAEAPTVLSGIWSRNPANAQALAGAHGVTAFATFDELVEMSDVVTLAVPPAVQPDLAVRAAAAGKHLLLEKPLALDVAGAQRIADAVYANGVGSIVLLTYRFAQVVRDFLEQAAALECTGGRAAFLSGAFLAGNYAGGWRHESGVLLDVGPHILDLVDAALGPIVSVQARGDVHGWVSVVAEHASGAVSDTAISCSAAIEPSRTEVEVFGPFDSLSVDARSGPRPQSFATLRREVAALTRGTRHPCDAARGLHLQRVVAATTRALSGWAAVMVEEPAP